MQLHIGTKQVTATPMTRRAYNDYRGWTVPADEDGGDKGYLVEYLDGGKPNHPAHAGYISWSPKAQFDAAYRPTTGMSFGLAIESLKAGKRVARAGWNGNRAATGFIPPTREPVVYNGLGYILLASGEVAIFEPEDFDMVAVQSNWCLMGNGYPSFTRYHEGGGGESRETVRLHDLLMPGAPMVDHINGDKLDNRRRNLRICGPHENNANRASVSGTSSRFKGVTWDKSREKWMAAIAAYGKSKTLGRFDSEEEAARAYDSAAKAAYGEFARLNFPEPRMWLALSCDGEREVAAENLWSPHNAQFARDNGGTAIVLPSITMKTTNAHGRVGILMGWLASQTDMLSDDWVIVH